MAESSYQVTDRQAHRGPKAWVFSTSGSSTCPGRGVGQFHLRCGRGCGNRGGNRICSDPIYAAAAGPRSLVDRRGRRSASTHRQSSRRHGCHQFRQGVGGGGVVQRSSRSGLRPGDFHRPGLRRRCVAGFGVARGAAGGADRVCAHGGQIRRARGRTFAGPWPSSTACSSSPCSACSVRWFLNPGNTGGRPTSLCWSSSSEAFSPLAGG